MTIESMLNSRLTDNRKDKEVRADSALPRQGESGFEISWSRISQVCRIGRTRDRGAGPTGARPRELGGTRNTITFKRGTRQQGDTRPAQLDYYH